MIRLHLKAFFFSFTKSKQDQIISSSQESENLKKNVLPSICRMKFKTLNIMISILSSTLFLTLRILLSNHPVYTFWFLIATPGCCGNCTVTFFWGRTAGATRMCKKAMSNSQSSYFRWGSFIHPQERNVAEEVQFNVTVGKGHPFPGNLLHTPVSSHTATNDVICGCRYHKDKWEELVRIHFWNKNISRKTSTVFPVSKSQIRLYKFRSFIHLYVGSYVDN